ncbi:hypothetical protein BpHYR1_013735 [Brachionus plicatilis]|uniref:Uncharacterized protein n=1 Tax=Brachionus plicatilis TaxID=10195 RepID=A0A3M7PA61_BRAPC|nr:hypothetical protein BpHYR1_013735 [Brachionus plicatilis]
MEKNNFELNSFFSEYFLMACKIQKIAEAELSNLGKKFIHVFRIEKIDLKRTSQSPLLKQVFNTVL